MVTFNCEVCNATVPKKQTEKHYYKCPQAYYTCIDCNKTFDDGYSYQQHTECITEDEKYQGKLYKNKNKKDNTNNNKGSSVTTAKKEVSEKKVDKKEVDKKEVDKKDSKDKDLNDLLVKGESLYKIIKKIENNKDLKKKLLKKLVVNENGQITL